MRPYGAKRIYAGCKVIRAKAGRARKIRVTVKNRKLERGDYHETF